ncbi:hypothetical protein C8J57DRAFT_1542507 [Mycena rebaudengoi]|nr:hypothetical protein C8J57DRAFT_1542507 [Mycena rebaudengoi]
MHDPGGSLAACAQRSRPPLPSPSPPPAPPPQCSVPDLERQQFELELEMEACGWPGSVYSRLGRMGCWRRPQDAQTSHPTSSSTISSPISSRIAGSCVKSFNSDQLKGKGTPSLNPFLTNPPQDVADIDRTYVFSDKDIAWPGEVEKYATNPVGSIGGWVGWAERGRGPRMGPLPLVPTLLALTFVLLSTFTSNRKGNLLGIIDRTRSFEKYYSDSATLLLIEQTKARVVL